MSDNPLPDSIDFVLSDFVNRVEQIRFMRQMVREEVEPRVLVVEGQFGIGKSYLIKEFGAQCQEDGIDVVRLDLEEKYADPGYVYVVKEIWTQLGPAGFDPLAQSMQEIARQSAREYIVEEFQSLQARTQIIERAPIAGTRSEALKESAVLAPEGEMEVGRSGGVNIYAGTNTFRDVAGRDINNFFQIIQREDPFVQEKTRLWITEILRQCLVNIATERRITILIDHWQKADTETRNWLIHSLVKWIADFLIPKMSIVIAGVEGVELNPRRRIKRVLLQEFDEEAIYMYLVEKRGCSKEIVPDIIRITGGYPLMLVMALARRNGSNSSSNRG